MHHQEILSRATFVLWLVTFAIMLSVVLMPVKGYAETIPPVTTTFPLMGTYGTAQNVTLTCSDGAGSGCATTFYCLGSDCTPTTPYIGPVSIAASTALRFYSTDLDGNSEQVRAHTYTIDPALAYRFSRMWPQLTQPWYLNTPYSVANDPAGNIYVADTGNNRIQKFDASGAFVTNWGTYGTANGQFISPSAITLDPTGNVYVADTDNNRIQKFTADGVFVTAWGSSGSDAGQFTQPLGIAADQAGNIYVVDAGNNRIQKFNASGTFVTSWGAYGNGDGQLNNPYSIATDSAGNVYVADTGNGRIQKFDSGGTFVLAWGLEGSATGQFIQPSGIAVDPGGNVYVADTNNQRIQKFTSGGVFVSAWGSEGLDNGKFSYPRGITTDSVGNVYVADTGNSRIQKFAPSEAFVTAWSSWGSGTGQFKGPAAITVLNTAGYVYVADTDNNRIQEFTSTGSFIRSWGSYGSGTGQFSAPQGITLDSSGLVYVADSGNHRIQRFNSWGTYLTSWGTFGSDNGQFSAPSGIAVDPTGNVYVVDTGNHRIQKFTAGGTFIFAWGSPGSGDGQFDVPRSIAVDASGYVYVTDTDNNRIQKFDTSGAFIASWGSYGSSNGEFDSPRGITTDSAGNIYVTDFNNKRIQKFTGGGDFITAWGVFGSGNGQFSFPQGITVDSASGSVFITDTGNNRVQKFTPVPAPPGAPTGVTATAANGQATVTFSTPASNGGSPIISYTVTSSPGSITASGSASPITVTGLANGNAYTFTVTATNANGTGAASTSSNSVTPVAQTYSLNLTVSGTGTIHSTPAPDINCSGSCGQTYTSDTDVTLAATPGSNYSFSGWSGDCSGSGSCIVTMSQARSVTATFAPTVGNGACGSAHNSQSPDTPVANLCSAGTPSAVNGIGPWGWTCIGSGGGTTASCSATQAGGVFYRSSDGGATWIGRATGIGFNSPINALEPSPGYPVDHTIFLGSADGTYKSTNSGDSWTLVQTGYSVVALTVSPEFGTDRTIFSGWQLAGISKSTDGGATWNATNSGLTSTQIRSLAVSPAFATDQTIFTGILGNGVYKSTNGGTTWSAANTGISNLTPLSLAVSPTYSQDSTLFAATSAGIYKSTNGGGSWALTGTGLSGSITSVRSSPAFAIDHTLFAATNSGIYKSTDSGTTWAEVYPSLHQNLLVLSPGYGWAGSDQSLFAGIYGHNVYASANGGASWTPSNSDFATIRQLSALAISPAFYSDNTLFAAAYFAGPQLFVSTESLSFESVTTGTTSTSQQVTITNGMFGDANLAISSISLSGTGMSQFSVSPGTCGTLTPVLAKGAECSINVTFTPTSIGSKSATLHIASNAILMPTASISLNGTGTGGTVSSTIYTPFINGNTVYLSGTASCSAGDTIALVEISINGGATWQPASGTTSWSITLSLPDGSYPIKSRATTNASIVETPGSGVLVTTPGAIDTEAPTGTLALYNGVWTLNANARDGGMCLMVYPLICGTLEMSPNGVSGWQPATTTPGTSGPLWLRDRAGNVSAMIVGALSNDNGGPIRFEGGSSTYYSYLQHALNAAGSGTVLKLTAAQYSEALLANTNTTYTVRGGYNSSHSAITGTTQLNGTLTVQAGTLTMENLEVTGSVTVAGGAVTANSIFIQ